MKYDLLSEVGMDYSTALKRFMNNAELLDELLIEFCSTDALMRAEALYDKGDYAAMFFPIHEIKGVAGNLSLNMLYTVLVTLTEALRSKNYENLPKQWQAVKENFEKTVKFILKAEKQDA